MSKSPKKKPAPEIGDLEGALLDIRTMASLLVDMTEGDSMAKREYLGLEKLDWLAHQLRDAVEDIIPRFAALQNAEMRADNGEAV